MAASLCKLSVTSSSPFVKNNKFTLSSRFSQTGLCHFPTWNGLKHMNMSLSPMPLNTRRRDRCKGKIVYASLFGVGAPEALVIGAVALLVFGPEGLAEVARNLGKTLRAFQPTIKELQEVSREFKNTLDREIGLDDTLRSTNGVPSNNAYSSDPLKIIEEHLKVATSPPQDLSSSQPEGLVEIESQSQDNSPPYDATSSEDQTEITEEQLETSAFTQHDVTSSTPPPASPNEDDNQPQVAIQETAIAAPPTELPELR